MISPIPFLDLRKQYQSIREEIRVAINSVCEETAFSGGKFIEQFEKDFAQYCGTKYCVAVNNGTSALHLAMLALGIKAGDEVIVPANTFIATAWGASYTGATPVFIDCDPLTWEIDPNSVQQKITKRTKAIMGVHLYGQPFDIETLQSVAKKNGLYLVEDAAQAHGARYKGTRVGGFGEMACFSFYPGKNLGTYGEGGGITTNNESYYRHLLSLRNHGSSTRYYHDEIGYNMRMGGFEAAVLSVKLKYLDQWNSDRKKVANRYRQEIKNALIRFQHEPDFSESAHHLAVITTDNREKLIKHLNENNIFPGLHYPVPCHLQKAYRDLGYQKGSIPNAEYLSEHCLSLPMYAELNSDEIDYIISTVNSYS
ncbi:glutamine--scyllo-inositol aminotransferase [Cytophagales bacterium WSM2-2]|nr:glutamine--scyllo-inositol aminotransferase [Cytophagales bacterium WSM2-2]